MTPASRACFAVALLCASDDYSSARAQSASGNASTNLSACLGTRARALVPSSAAPRASAAVWLEARSGDAVTLVDVLAVKARRASALRCALGTGASTCDIRLVSALETAAGDGARALDVRLDADTNLPDVASAEQLSPFLAVSTPLGCFVEVLGGAWLSPSLLRVRFVRPNCTADDAAVVNHDGRVLDGDALVAALVTVAWPREPEGSEHKLVSREVSRSLVGAFVLGGDDEQSDALFVSGLELAESGAFLLRLCAVSEDDGLGEDCVARLASYPPSLAGCVCRVLAERTLVVNACAAEEFAALGRERPRLDGIVPEGAERPNPAWSLRGVVSVGGMGVVVPFGNLPEGARTQGSWSLSFWAYFLDSSSRSGHRVLFFHGHGDGDQSRTPSAWFDSDSERLLLRCSDAEMPDIGGTSVGAVPVRKWVHLAFVFNNATTSNATLRQFSFRYEFYMDGKLDSELTFSPRVSIRANDGPFSIGKAKGFAGAAALLAQLRMFDGALSAAQVAQEFEATRSLLGRGGATSLQPSLTSLNEAQLLRGVVDATDLSTSWGLTDRFTMLDILNLRAPAGRGCPLSCESATASRLWSATLNAFSISFDAVLGRFVADAAPLQSATLSDFGVDVEYNFAALSSCEADFEEEYERLSLAAASGNAIAQALLADLLEAPLRDTCPSELRLLAPALEGVAGASVLRERTASNPFAAVIAIALSALARAVDANATSRPSSAVPAFLLRDEENAWGLRFSAAMKASNERALYFLGLGAILEGQPPDPLPSARDTALGHGLLHLAAARGSPFAIQLLARRYSGTEGHMAAIPAVTRRAESRGGTSTSRTDVKLFKKIASALSRLIDLEARPISNAGDESLASADEMEHAEADAGLVDHFFTAHALGVPHDDDLSCFYAAAAAEESSEHFHAPSGRPLHEMQRLSVDAADSGEVELVQRGDDEQLIAFQRAQCEQEVAHRDQAQACANTADLYSWGARGLDRNLQLSFRYYSRAATLGHAPSLLVVAQMLLKGEGVAQNVSAAVSLYEQELIQSNGTSIHALNALGYAHFNGIDGESGLARNATRAFEYFVRASDLGDSDATFNAGHCLDAGLGTQQNTTAAMARFEAGVALGHFDCILALGRIFALGRVPGSPVRNVARALPLLTAVAKFGPWAGLVRRGFERYLVHDYEGAYLRYLQAHALGYEIGAANAAYLLQRGLVRRHKHQLPVAFRLHQASFAASGRTDSALAIAEFFLRGSGGVRADPTAAVALLSRASAAGSAQAAFTLGVLFDDGAAGLQASASRSELYFRRALELAPSEAARRVAQFALARLAARKWVKDALLRYGLGALLWFRADNTNGAVSSNASALRPALFRPLETSSILFLRLFESVNGGERAPNSAHESRALRAGSSGAIAAVLVMTLFVALVVATCRRAVR